MKVWRVKGRNMKSVLRLIRVVAGVLVVAAVGGVTAPGAWAKDYLVAVSHPNNIHLIDVKARQVVATHVIPGDGAPIPVTITPRGKVAYVLTNHLGSVVGINLETGEQVFRADMSSGNERVRTMAAIAISADGSELFVHQAPVKLLAAEYQVQDTRIAVYDTSAGIGAKPKRVLPAPRAIMLMSPSPDGKYIYAFNVDMFKLDAQTGEILETVLVAHWDHPVYEPATVLLKWQAINMTGVFMTPISAVVKGMDPDNPMAHATVMMKLDPATGALTFQELERGGPIQFSMVQHPAKPNTVFSNYLVLTKWDLSAQDKIVRRLTLEHTYYNINISSDGEEIYLGGTMADIAVYGAAELDRRATIKLPGSGDQSLGFIRMVTWDDAPS